MPSSVVKSYAKKSGKTEKQVEKIWDDCKAKADKLYKGKPKDGKYWGFVNNCTKKKLGIATEEVSILTDW